MSELISYTQMPHVLYWSVPVALVICSFILVRFLYYPRSFREWKLFAFSRTGRYKLRTRKKRLDAVLRNRPGSILPDVPTSQRDFALDTLIRKHQFKQARNYIHEQISQLQRYPGGRRVDVYLKYLDLLEGASG